MNNNSCYAAGAVSEGTTEGCGVRGPVYDAGLDYQAERARLWVSCGICPVVVSRVVSVVPSTMATQTEDPSRPSNTRASGHGTKSGDTPVELERRRCSSRAALAQHTPWPAEEVCKKVSLVTWIEDSTTTWALLSAVFHVNMA